MSLQSLMLLSVIFLTCCYIYTRVSARRRDRRRIDQLVHPHEPRLNARDRLDREVKS